MKDQDVVEKLEEAMESGAKVILRYNQKPFNIRTSTPYLVNEVDVK